MAFTAIIAFGHESVNKLPPRITYKAPNCTNITSIHVHIKSHTEQDRIHIKAPCLNNYVKPI